MQQSKRSGPTAAGLSVVVLDSQPMWLEAIRGVIERLDLCLVAATTDGEEALDAIATGRPNLFVLDPSAGDPPWRTYIPALLETWPSLKVVAMSASDDREQIDAAFSAGASAYVVKTASELDIGAAFRLALTTAIHVAPVVSARLPVRVDEDALGCLTRRELEILRLAADGYTNAALGRRLWVTEQTVKFHLSNIYRKIGVQNRTAAARWASAHGLVGGEDEPAASSAVTTAA